MGEPAFAVPEVVIRPAVDDDRGLVFRAWKETWRESAFAKREFHATSLKLYYALLNVALDRIVPTCRIVVAAFPEATHTLVGFAAAQRGKLRYVYVKPVFRGAGYARKMVSALGCTDARWSFDLLSALEDAW